MNPDKYPDKHFDTSPDKYPANHASHNGANRARLLWPRRSRLTCVALAAYVAMLGVAQADCSPEETVIKFSHAAAGKGHPKGDAVAYFARRVNKQMDGRFCVKVYPNAVLYDDEHVVDALMADEVQMAAPTLSKLEKYTLQFRVFDLPFLFKNIDAVNRFQNSSRGQQLLNSLQGKGLIGLGFWHNGMKQLSADRPLLLPPDVKGLKFRIQPSTVLAAQFRVLGAHPQKIPFKDTYGALAAGVVNGQENTWSNIYTNRFFEVQDSITQTNHGVLDYVVLVSKPFWNQLRAKDRTELAQIFNQVTAARNHLAKKINRQNLRKIIEEGGTVHYLNDLQRQAWQDAMQPVWAEFEDDIGKDLIAAALAENG